MSLSRFYVRTHRPTHTELMETSRQMIEESWRLRAQDRQIIAGGREAIQRSKDTLAKTDQCLQRCWRMSE